VCVCVCVCVCVFVLLFLFFLFCVFFSFLFKAACCLHSSQVCDEAGCHLSMALKIGDKRC
jgi:hypothetical protein